MTTDLRRSFKQKAKQAFELPSRLKKGLTDGLNFSEEPTEATVDGSKRPSMSFDYGCLLYQDNKHLFSEVIDVSTIKNNANTIVSNDNKIKSRIVAQPEGTIKYVVSGRDTLRSLAALHETTSSELKKLNRLVTDTIFEGQTLFVPGQTYEPENDFKHTETLANMPSLSSVIDAESCLALIKMKTSSDIEFLKISTSSSSFTNANYACEGPMKFANILHSNEMSNESSSSSSSATTVASSSHVATSFTSSTDSSLSITTTSSSSTLTTTCTTIVPSLATSSSSTITSTSQPVPSTTMTTISSSISPSTIMSMQLTKLSLVPFYDGKFIELDPTSYKDLLFTGIKPILSATKQTNRYSSMLQDNIFTTSATNNSHNDDVLNSLTSQEFIKLPVKHIVACNNKQSGSMVDGLLLLSREFIMFDPDVTDPHVAQVGIEESSVIIPVTDVASAALTCETKDKVYQMTHDSVVVLYEDADEEEDDAASNDIEKIKDKESNRLIAESDDGILMGETLNTEKLPMQPTNQPILKVNESNGNRPPVCLPTNIKVISDNDETADFDLNLMDDEISSLGRCRKRTKSSSEASKVTNDSEKNMERNCINKKRASSVRRNRPLSFVGNLFRFRNNSSESSPGQTADITIGTTSANSESNLLMASSSVKLVASSLDNINNVVPTKLMAKTLNSISSYSNSIIDDVSSHLFHSSSSSSFVSGPTTRLQAITSSPNSPTSSTIQEDTSPTTPATTSSSTNHNNNLTKDRAFFLKPIDMLTKKVKEQLSSSTESTADDDTKENELLLTIRTLNISSFKLQQPSTQQQSQQLPSSAQQQQQTFVFCVPSEKTSLLFSFFLSWSPNAEPTRYNEPYFVLVSDKNKENDRTVNNTGSGSTQVDVDDDKKCCAADVRLMSSDDVESLSSWLQADNNSEIKHNSKTWKIVNVQEMKRMMLMMEIERLPLPELSDASHIMNEAHIKQLTFHLPARAEGCTWHLVYSTERHGFSIRTLFRRMDKVEGPVLLVIKDHKDMVFGAMLSQALKPSENFYGGGECYLYTFKNQFVKYSWTGANNFFMYGGNNCISIGSGEDVGPAMSKHDQSPSSTRNTGGAHGLWFDENLYHGRTQRCLTFNNDPLTVVEDFVVKYLETWKFV